MVRDLTRSSPLYLAAGRAQRYFVLVRISVVQYELALYSTASVRLNAISYWRADFKLNLQRYSVLDSELLDTRWNSSAIRDTRFTVSTLDSKGIERMLRHKLWDFVTQNVR